MEKLTPDFISNQPLLQNILDLALKKKAKKLITLDLRGLSTFANYFVICHGDSEPHVKAIADNIRKGTIHKPLHIEGYENQNWILIDYFDIVIHVFKKEFRDFYGLERLWADAPLKKVVYQKT